jgi:GMP synthase (glutamine-hydrolysing)
VEIEDLGYLGKGLEGGGIEFEYRDAESVTPELDGDGPIVVLGGPMGVYESERFPFLEVEIELLRQGLASGRPILGICLGAQLLAAAAGAAVRPGARGKEIGWAPVELVDAGAVDPLWHGFPRRFHTFHWHGDSFDLPDDAVALARSEHYLQAFRIGSKAYGVQFHPEVVPDELQAWIHAYRLELERENLTSEDVLAVPNLEEHRRLAHRFGQNVATWLRTGR